MKSGTISEKKEKKRKKQEKQTEDNGQERGTEETNIKINQPETETGTKSQTEEINKRQPHNTLLSRLRTKGSPTSGGIQPRQGDKGKDNECETWRF